MLIFLLGFVTLYYVYVGVTGLTVSAFVYSRVLSDTNHVPSIKSSMIKPLIIQSTFIRGWRDGVRTVFSIFLMICFLFWKNTIKDKVRRFIMRHETVIKGLSCECEMKSKKIQAFMQWKSHKFYCWSPFNELLDLLIIKSWLSSLCIAHYHMMTTTCLYVRI